LKPASARGLRKNQYVKLIHPICQCLDSLLHFSPANQRRRVVKKVAILALVSSTLIAGAGPSLADQGMAQAAPFALFQLDEAGVEQQPARGKARKTVPRVEENRAHWGRHHEKGVHLEGSEHPAMESARAGGRAPSYD
jgi:hypothetical protein